MTYNPQRSHMATINHNIVSDERFNKHLIMQMTVWPDCIDKLIWNGLTHMNIVNILFSFDAVVITKRDLKRIINNNPTLYEMYRENFDKYMQLLDR